MDKNSSIQVGVDIGTTEVRCVIGRHGAEDTTTPTIIGSAMVENKGMRKGEVVKIDEVAKSIDDCVEKAAHMAGVDVGSATININGPHIIAQNSRGVIAVSPSDVEIGLHELERVEEAATEVKIPENREIIHVFARNYRLDGQNIKNPIGMKGVRLEVDAHVVTGLSPTVATLNDTISAAGLSTNNLMLSSVAAANLVLSTSQRENGAAIIDFGGSTTNIAVYEEEDLLMVSVLPVGSMNITNDLAIGLQTDLKTAEKIKLEHVDLDSDGRSSSKDIEIKTEDGEMLHFTRKQINEIVEPRLEEILELIDKELSKIKKSGVLPGGVVLVGGGSKLKGFKNYVKDELALPVHTAEIRDIKGITHHAKDLSFVTATSLMVSDTGGESKHSSRSSMSVRKPNLSSVKDAGSKAGGLAKSFLDRFRS